MTRSAIQHHSMQAPRGNQKVVFLAVVGALAFAALPFISKEVRRREQDVANMRDASYDAKDAARNSRLRIKRLCMHTLTRRAARILSEHLAIISSAGPVIVRSTQNISGVVVQQQHSMAGSTGKLQAAPETLWQRVVAAGRCSETGTEYNVTRKRHKTSSGSDSAAKCENIAIMKRNERCRGSQASSVARPREEGTTDLGQGSIIMYAPAAFSAKESVGLFQSLQDDVEWQAREVTVMGRRVMQPRLVAYMADHGGLKYTYSGACMVPSPWNDAVLKIKDRVEELSGSTFNSCLLNFYRTGMDHMSFHSDNEPLYGGGTCTIGSASFGSARDFILRRNVDHNDRLSYPLGCGDVLVMKGTLQQHWMHSVPRRKRVSGGRISLTFRQIVNPEVT